jgi:hypothetical protein
MSLSLCSVIPEEIQLSETLDRLAKIALNASRRYAT